jgi:hypothetical protein
LTDVLDVLSLLWLARQGKQCDDFACRCKYILELPCMGEKEEKDKKMGKKEKNVFLKLM